MLPNDMPAVAQRFQEKLQALVVAHQQLQAENIRLREQLAAYEEHWGTLYARRSSGL